MRLVPACLTLACLTLGGMLAAAPALAQAAGPAGGAAAKPTASTGTATTGTAPANPGAGDVQISEKAYAIASQLRCPVCTAESVADSSAQISVEMRSLIQSQLDAGKSQAQIIAYFRKRYGDWILLDPPKQGLHLLVWLLPVLALLAGLAALGLLFRRWRAAAEATPQADAAALARVRQALEAAPAGAVSGSGPPPGGGAPSGQDPDPGPGGGADADGEAHG